MASRWRLAAGCAVLLGVAAQAEARDQVVTRPKVGVVVYNQAGIAADTLARAKSEIARIYGEAGIDVIWGNPGAVEPADTFAIQLLIRPRAVNASGSVMGTSLGDVHEHGGSAFVFYDRVLSSAHDRHQDVAGVLAYAMAHEMGHLLLPFPAHSSSGIMRPNWDGDDLRHIASESLQFTVPQADAIRAKVSSCCASTPAEAAPHVRGESDRAIALLQEGKVRSATIQSLIAALESSDVFVFVDVARRDRKRAGPRRA